MASRPKAPAVAPPADDPVSGIPEPAAQVLRQFRLVFSTVRSHFRDVQRQADVGGAQLWALSVVHKHPGIGVSGLAKAMNIHQTTASNLVRSLVAQKLIATEKNGPDKRTVQLRLLTAGKRVLLRAPGPLMGVLPDALCRLDAKTLARLDHDLAALLKVLNADERAAGIPLAQM